MVDHNHPFSSVAECLDYALHSIISGKSSSIEGIISFCNTSHTCGKAMTIKNLELIRSIVAEGKCSTLTSRYCDFFSLISRIEKAENWKDFSLQDLLSSVKSLVQHIVDTDKINCLIYNIPSAHFCQGMEIQKCCLRRWLAQRQT